MVEHREHPLRIDGALILLMNLNKPSSNLITVVMVNGELIGLELVPSDQEDLGFRDDHEKLYIELKNVQTQYIITYRRDSKQSKV